MATGIGNYGPTDTTNLVTLTAQAAGKDEFVEYRATFKPKAASNYLPAIQFV